MRRVFAASAVDSGIAAVVRLLPAVPVQHRSQQPSVPTAAAGWSNHVMLAVTLVTTCALQLWLLSLVTQTAASWALQRDPLHPAVMCQAPGWQFVSGWFAAVVLQLSFLSGAWYISHISGVPCWRHVWIQALLTLSAGLGPMTASWHIQVCHERSCKAVAVCAVMLHGIPQQSSCQGDKLVSNSCKYGAPCSHSPCCW